MYFISVIIKLSKNKFDWLKVNNKRIISVELIFENESKKF